MRVVYRCSRCGGQIAELHLPVLSEAALGLDALTPEERADIISFDAAAETVSLRSLCDRCVEGLEMDAPLPGGGSTDPPAVGLNAALHVPVRSARKNGCHGL